LRSFNLEDGGQLLLCDGMAIWLVADIVDSVRCCMLQLMIARCRDFYVW
jgi:hypothetical protein